MFQYCASVWFPVSHSSRLAASHLSTSSHVFIMNLKKRRRLFAISRHFSFFWQVKEFSFHDLLRNVKGEMMCLLSSTDDDILLCSEWNCLWENHHPPIRQSRRYGTHISAWVL